MPEDPTAPVEVQVKTCRTCRHEHVMSPDAAQCSACAHGIACNRSRRA